MKNKFLLSVIGLFVIQPSWAMNLADCFPNPDYTHYDPEVGKGDPFLYEIRIPNEKVLPEINNPNKTHFYLLGSQHNVPIDILQRSTLYIVEKAEVFITEIYYKKKII